ncbi:MAG: hypothetical protein HYV24_09590 [Deltaproteobacteria bacterium]|nr:hypothetical protein [Deltaproteobacteria bacterium]
MATPEEIKTEDKKLRLLRRMVDLTMSIIIETDMTLEEASRHAAGVRELALRLFPGKGDVFDLVYGPRFKRLLRDKYMLS